VFVGGVLIPIRYLINGATIIQEPVDSVTYWHIELERHDVVLAEGLPCESYLDTGNRAAFANGGGGIILHPDFAMRIWKTKACAQLVLKGAKLSAARRRLLRRTKALDFAITDDPDLRVFADRQLLPLDADRRHYRVRLPSEARNVRIVTRSWIPAYMRPAEDDHRRLGVAIARVWVDHREVSLDSPTLSTGWHDPEPKWRWTDGQAGLALSGVRELAFGVAMTGSYWQERKYTEAQTA
jgi:hypothetical protein